MPATTGNRSLSRAPRPSPMSSGSSWALSFPTISWCRPGMAATSSGSIAASRSSRGTGEIAAPPRLFAVQAANCAAFAAAWAAGEDRFVPFAAKPTVADGIATPKPVRIAEVLAALRHSKGGVVAVAEDEIAPALAALGRLGLFVEPTAAIAGAALTRLLRDGTIAGRSIDGRGVDRLRPQGRRPNRRASRHRHIARLDQYLRIAAAIPGGGSAARSTSMTDPPWRNVIRAA